MTSSCVAQQQVATGGTVSISGLHNAGLMTLVTLNDTTWTALPLTALAGRNAMGIQNQSNVEIKINYDNTTVGYVGVKIGPDAERYYDITDAIVIYGKSSSGTPTILVEEIS